MAEQPALNWTKAGSIPVRGTKFIMGLLSFLIPKNIMLPIALIAAAAASLYIWSLNQNIKSLNTQIVALEADKIVLTSSLEAQQTTISFLKNQTKLLELAYRDTEQAFADARRDAEKLKKQIQAVDVDALSIQSTGASELAINTTTASLYRCFELLSGAPLNEKEMAAKNAQEFNTMCSWLYNP